MVPARRHGRWSSARRSLAHSLVHARFAWSMSACGFGSAAGIGFGVGDQVQHDLGGGAFDRSTELGGIGAVPPRLPVARRPPARGGGLTPRDPAPRIGG